MQREVVARLDDALTSARKIQTYVLGMDVASYLADEKTRQACERNFEIIGEAINAARKIDDRLLTSISSARQIIDFRHLLIHGYSVINHEIVWGVIQEDLPILVSELAKLIEESESIQD